MRLTDPVRPRNASTMPGRTGSALANDEFLARVRAAAELLSEYGVGGARIDQVGSFADYV